MIVKGKASDPDRSYAPMPGRGGLLEPLTSDPFDRERTIECFEQIADLKVFNRNLTIRRTYAGTSEEASGILRGLFGGFLCRGL
jgi:hypothetical protein